MARRRPASSPRTCTAPWRHYLPVVFGTLVVISAGGRLSRRSVGVRWEPLRTVIRLIFVRRLTILAVAVTMLASGCGDAVDSGSQPVVTTSISSWRLVLLEVDGATVTIERLLFLDIDEDGFLPLPRVTGSADSSGANS